MGGGDMTTEADAYLNASNPRLQTLRDQYGSFIGSAFPQTVWTESYVNREVDLNNFRGEGAYIWDRRDGNTEEKYLATAAYVNSIDCRELLNRLTEDTAFAAYTVRTSTGKVVSRDLLDSIVQIYFLDRALGLANRQNFHVLDIGAGYGRFAHRFAEAFPNLGTVYCTDTVPESTFIAEFYLRYRGVADRALVIPLPDVEAVLSTRRVDLAVNIHSFCNECSRAAVLWWLTRLERYGVRHLMIVPNAGDHGGTRLVTREPDDTQQEMRPMLRAHGYNLVRDEPKYLDPIVQASGVSPTRHYLFELQEKAEPSMDEAREPSSPGSVLWKR
jgi:SAM-dependent methyltransferase